jgi:hypothetical protein
MTFKYPDLELEGGYDQYRNTRRNILQTYCFAVLEKNKDLERVIGVSTEPLGLTSTESSEDLIMTEPPEEWSDYFLEKLKLDCKTFNVFQGGFTPYSVGVEEYPD